MAKSVKQKQQTESLVQRNELITKLGFDVKKLNRSTPRLLTDAQRAKLLDVKVAEVKLPIILTPKQPVKGKSTLTIYTAAMVDPKWPADSGWALFSSQMQFATFPGVQVAFPRVKTGKKHLVEFNVGLTMNKEYKFRIFAYPLGEFQDISVQGPKTTTLAILVPPIDEISGSLELGASIQQRNTQNESAGWVLYSVRISTTV